MNEHLQNGWRLLKTFDCGALGATGLATAPETNFLRLVRVLRQRESYTPLLNDDRAVAAEDVAPSVSDLRRHFVSWRLGQPEVPALALLEVAHAPPVATLRLDDPAAAARLPVIAEILARFHQHGVSMNLLSPRSIAYWSREPDAAPIFFDAGIDCRADLDELQDPALVGRAYRAGDVGFWAPEQVTRLAERRPASFQPASDSYFLAAAWVVYASGRDIFDGASTAQALADGPQLLARAAQNLRVPHEVRELLARVFTDAPGDRPSIDELGVLWKTRAAPAAGKLRLRLALPPALAAKGRGIAQRISAATRGSRQRGARWLRALRSARWPRRLLRRTRRSPKPERPTAVERVEPGATPVERTAADEATAARRRRAAATLLAVLGLGAGFGASAEARAERRRALAPATASAVTTSTVACARSYASAWRLAEHAAAAAKDDEQSRAHLARLLDELDANGCAPSSSNDATTARLPPDWASAAELSAQTRALIALARARAGLGDARTLLEQAVEASPSLAARLRPHEGDLLDAPLPLAASPSISLPYANAGTN